MTRLCHCLACIVLGLLQPVAGAAVSLTLHHDAAVAGGRVNLADVADVALPARVSIGNIIIGLAPRPGDVSPISRAEIERAVRRETREPILWHGADVVRVRALTQRVPGRLLAEAALNAMTSRVRTIHPNAVVRLAGEVKDVELRPGPFHLIVRPDRGERWRSREIGWVDLMQGEVVARTIAVPLVITASGHGFYAAHDIAAGEWLTRADLEVRELDLLALAAAPFEMANGGRLRAARRIQAGQLVTGQALALPDEVLPGDKVRVAVASGAVRIEASGVALGTAEPGQPVAVRMTDGQSLTGRLTGNRVVEVE